MFQTTNQIYIYIYVYTYIKNNVHLCLYMYCG